MPPISNVTRSNKKKVGVILKLWYVYFIFVKKVFLFSQQLTQKARKYSVPELMVTPVYDIRKFI